MRGPRRRDGTDQRSRALHFELALQLALHTGTAAEGGVQDRLAARLLEDLGQPDIGRRVGEIDLVEVDPPLESPGQGAIQPDDGGGRAPA